ncbi:hypothetical protein LV779_18835 [Streptomyces thinghirensis]|nr:hypothetical protein [Streptomyces thinghirensis]
MRVPVFSGHSLQINARFARPISVERARGAAGRRPRRRAHRGADPARGGRSGPSYVGRIRQDETVDNGLALVRLQRQPAQGRGP